MIIWVIKGDRNGFLFKKSLTVVIKVLGKLESLQNERLNVIIQWYTIRIVLMGIILRHYWRESFCM